MGDFWGISLYKRDLNDGRGTSLVLANNAKGAAVLESVKDSVKRIEKNAAGSCCQEKPFW